QVVRVRADGDGREAALRGDLLRDIAEALPAEVAAVDRIGRVARVRQLAVEDNLVRHGEIARERDGRLALLARVRLAVDDERERLPGPERVRADLREHGRVDAAAEGDEHAGARAEGGGQLRQRFGGLHAAREADGCRRRLPALAASET